MEKKVLLISPDMYSHYTSKIKIAVNPLPPLTIVTLAAQLLDYNVRIFDMSLTPDYDVLIKTLKNFNPDYVCITSLTPSFNEAKKIVALSKHHTNAKIILGGPHVSSFPKSCLEDSKADIVVKGEGDVILKNIINEKSLKNIAGICYKKNGKILKNPDQSYIPNLDILPYPAWHLLDIKKYKCSKLVSRKSHVGPIETSRGCIYSCVYCNKNIFGTKFRIKSPQRVVEEIKFMLNLGFEEVHIQDDGFSTDLNRGKKICKLILKEKLEFPWALANGIRIDRVDEELVCLLKKAGGYRISYGIESGNQKVLDSINKGITLEQKKRAVNLAKKYNLETHGFFMLGLPGDTEETMQQTIDFAQNLNLDICKASITMPLPGTPLYQQLNQNGRIKVKDWSMISQHTRKEIYSHPHVRWETICNYYSKFYNQNLYSFPYISKRIKKGLWNGQVLWDIYYFLKSLTKPL